MAEISRPKEVEKRGAVTGIKRGGVVRGVDKAKVTKISRPGPLIRKSKSQLAQEKYKSQGYIAQKPSAGITEYRAPKTKRYASSWDRDRPRGKTYDYSYYSPESIYVDESGNIVKKVDRGTYKIGGGARAHYTKGIYDTNIQTFGKVNGHTTREEKQFRVHEGGILPYQTSYYVDKTYVGRDKGRYSEVRDIDRQREIDKEQQERAEREAIKKKLDPEKVKYVPPPGAYYYPKQKDSQYFGPELTKAFQQARTPKSYYDVGKRIFRKERKVEVRPHPMSVRRAESWGGIITRETKPVRIPGISPEILKPTKVQQAGLGKKIQPTSIFKQDLGDKIFGTKSANNLKNKLKKII